jgi:Spy/CpxP family protein refolding chaperone
MTRVRRLMVLAGALVLGAALVAATQAQAAEGGRRGFRGFNRGSLLGLLRMEQVQKEMKLTDEQATKVKEVVEKLGAEMREKGAGLRDIENRDERRAKMAELSDEFDRKVREQLRDVVPREQMMRLYQIRMQVRPVADSLASKFIASRLKLTEEQQAKVAQIAKDMQAKQSELFAGMREASQEQRTQAFEKMRKIRSDADEQVLAVLTPEQKEAFQKMQGEKFELQRPGQ